MTGPTPAPNALGEGSWTAMPSAPTNGHTAPYGFGRSAGVLPGDQRTFDDIEAGIVALWQRFGEGRQQRLRDRLLRGHPPLGHYDARRGRGRAPHRPDVADPRHHRRCG